MKIFLTKLWHKVKIALLLSGFKTPTSRERQLGEQLRFKIQSLPPLAPTDDLERQWAKYRMQLRDRIAKLEVRNFLNWDIIRTSMFHECAKEELDFLKKLPAWPVWEQALRESPVGNPRAYAWMPESSGNLIHNAYVLAKTLQATSSQLSDIATVFEFGGGYGGMCRLFRNLGFKGEYVIYDIQEFSYLQEYFLKSYDPQLQVAIGAAKEGRDTVVLLSNLDEVAQQFSGKNVDLFLATWSFSEAPVELREKILNVLPRPERYAVGYRDRFAAIDNVKFFENFRQTRPNYEWHHEYMDHLPENYLLFGSVKKQN